MLFVSLTSPTRLYWIYNLAKKKEEHLNKCKVKHYFECFMILLIGLDDVYLSKKTEEERERESSCAFYFCRKN